MTDMPFRAVKQHMVMSKFLLGFIYEIHFILPRAMTRPYLNHQWWWKTYNEWTRKMRRSNRRLKLP